MNLRMSGPAGSPESRVGTVTSVRRYPVKSMLGEDLDAVWMGARGIRGDRGFALIDDETGKVVSVKRPRRWGRIFELSAATVEDGSVEVTFPDGDVVGIRDPTLSGRLSEFFGRAVSLASSPPPKAFFDEVWQRDLHDGADPPGGARVRIEDDEELIKAGTTMGPQDSFFNAGIVHMVTTGTTQRLSELAPESRFDAHRFRPNLVIDTPETGFVETGWQGRLLHVGEVRLAVTNTVARCVMPTLAQGELPADRDVLRTIIRHNTVNLAPSWPDISLPCVGVYADVLVEGFVHVGDPVELGPQDTRPLEARNHR